MLTVANVAVLAIVAVGLALLALGLAITAQLRARGLAVALTQGLAATTAAVADGISNAKAEIQNGLGEKFGAISQRLDRDEAEIELATPVVVKTAPMKPDQMVKFDYHASIADAVTQHREYVASRKPGHPPFHYDQMVEAVASRVVRSAAAIGFAVEMADVMKRVRAAINKTTGEE